jgi:MarR family transcriptional regulator, lower aerobic nicotinate degradation pathway regulator
LVREVASAFDYTIGAVGHRVRRCHQLSMALFNEEVGPYGVTTIQYAALAAIADNDDIDATRLATLVAFDRSTVGAVLERLEAKGLIEREYRFHDKRTKRLRATDAGRALLADADAAVHRSQDRFLAVLDADERAILMELLAKAIARHEGTE